MNKEPNDRAPVERRVGRVNTENTIQREEWIKRAVASGAPSADYADSLYLAYTDDGESNMTPEEIVAEDERVIGIGR